MTQHTAFLNSQSQYGLCLRFLYAAATERRTRRSPGRGTRTCLTVLTLFLYHTSNPGCQVVTLQPQSTHQWLVVVWLAVVSSTDCLYAVALWLGCHSTSTSAWGQFWLSYWPPVPRPRLRPPLQPGGDGVRFPLLGVELGQSRTR